MYYCQICNKNFTNKYNLAKHQKTIYHKSRDDQVKYNHALYQLSRYYDMLNELKALGGSNEYTMDIYNKIVDDIEHCNIHKLAKKHKPHIKRVKFECENFIKDIKDNMDNYIDEDDYLSSESSDSSESDIEIDDLENIME